MGALFLNAASGCTGELAGASGSGGGGSGAGEAGPGFGLGPGSGSEGGAAGFATSSSASSGIESTPGGGGAGQGGEAGGAGGAPPATVCPGGPYAADPFPADRTPRRIRDGFDFLEGPVWFAELGALFFSDMHFGAQNPPPLNGPQATMHKLIPPDSFEVFIDNSATNGLGVGRGGGIIACTHDTRSLSVFDVSSGERTPVVDRYMGLRFNSPNDLVVRSDGNLYFSDPDWQLSGPSELPMAVYRVSPSGEVSVVDTMSKPNGVTLSPDEATLYVGAIDGRIRKYAVSADGATGEPSDFANVSGPDGMTVDCAGNVYVSGGGGVDVISPRGQRLGSISGVGSASNLAFGGADRKTLYITAGGSLYSIEMAIPGYPY